MALAVWDQSTYNALRLYNENNCIFNQTYQFISPITRFWKMCNIHSPGKDIRLRDRDLNVFKLQDMTILCFFPSFFLGFRIGRPLVVAIEQENLTHKPLRT